MSRSIARNSKAPRSARLTPLFARPAGPPIAQSPFADVGANDVSHVAVPVQVDADHVLVELIILPRIQRGIRRIEPQADRLGRPAVVGQHTAEDAGRGLGLVVGIDVSERFGNRSEDVTGCLVLNIRMGRRIKRGNIRADDVVPVKGVTARLHLVMGDAGAVSDIAQHDAVGQRDVQDSEHPATLRTNAGGAVAADRAAGDGGIAVDVCAATVRREVEDLVGIAAVLLPLIVLLVIVASASMKIPPPAATSPDVLFP